MASIYSAFANEGNMIKPYIEYKETATAEYIKENVFTAEAANTVKEDLIQVVENPEGTANDMKVAGVTIAGKTGTAHESKRRSNHALFISYAPYEDPKISVTVRIANGYDSAYAAQTARDVYKYYYGLAEEDELLTGTAEAPEATGGGGD